MSFRVLLLVAACVAVCAGQDENHGPAGNKGYQKVSRNHPIALGRVPFRSLPIDIETNPVENVKEYHKSVRNTPFTSLPNNLEVDLLKVFNTLDFIRYDVSVMAIETSNLGKDPQVIIDCFKAQKNLYYSIGEKLHDLLRQSAEEFAAAVGQTKAEKFAKNISLPIRNIGEIMKTLPPKMMELLEQQEFLKAVELMTAFREAYEENVRLIYRTVDGFRNQMPKVAKRAFILAENIRKESDKEIYLLRESFHKCVEESGPKQEEENKEFVEFN